MESTECLVKFSGELGELGRFSDEKPRVKLRVGIKSMEPPLNFPIELSQTRKIHGKRGVGGA
jgi:hypothetical protein